MGGFGFMSDRVARRSEYVFLQPLSEFLDVDRFRKRVSFILERGYIEPEVREMLQRFQRIPERDPSAQRLV